MVEAGRRGSGGVDVGAVGELGFGTSREGRDGGAA